MPPGDSCDSGTILSEGEGCAAPDEDVYGRFHRVMPFAADRLDRPP